MPLPLLGLPRELRDAIYYYYVFEPDGYHFDDKSGKLRASRNRPIDLQLMCVPPKPHALFESVSRRVALISKITKGTRADW